MKTVNKTYKHITLNSQIYSVMNHPAFSNWGHLIFPWDQNNRYSENMTMKDVPNLHLWHTNRDAQSMIDSVNRLIDDINSGVQVFYDIYTDEEKKIDPSKKMTGLFFLRGEEGKPYAVICPGGGFCYVGSLHEGFPIAMELNKNGYNAFVLKYRVGQGETVASHDLIAAVHFIQSHAKELGVSLKNYSLWGGSAGARMCSNVTYGEGGINRPQELLSPAVSVIAYTYYAGNPAFNPNDPAAYFIVGTDDWIVPWQEVKKRAEKMKMIGIPVEYHILKHTQHGFGVGTGTNAEGWIKQAISFWKKNSK